MADITVTVASVATLPQTVTRTMTAGGAMNLGDAVQWGATATAADGNAGGGAEKARGILINIEGGKTAAVSGDAVEIAVFGPVTGYSGMTPGALCYVSDTVGRIGDAAGTNSFIVGWAVDATTIFVQPEVK